jgi:hypothetical protein
VTLPDFEDPAWNAERERLEAAAVKALADLMTHARGCPMQLYAQGPEGERFVISFTYERVADRRLDG